MYNSTAPHLLIVRFDVSMYLFEFAWVYGIAMDKTVNLAGQSKVIFHVSDSLLDGISYWQNVLVSSKSEAHNLSLRCGSHVSDVH